jgi:hypothetical protein
LPPTVSYPTSTTSGGRRAVGSLVRAGVGVGGGARPRPGSDRAGARCWSRRGGGTSQKIPSGPSTCRPLPTCLACRDVWPRTSPVCRWGGVQGWRRADVLGMRRRICWSRRHGQSRVDWSGRSRGRG